MHLIDKRVLVYGAGKSGISATRLLQEQGAFVLLYDSNTNLKLDSFKEQFNIKKDFELIVGRFPEEIIADIDLVIISPGIPIDNSYVEQLRSVNLPIWGEIELAYQMSKGKVIGITGTNGKTTTTFLTGEILKTFFEDVHVVGNIGKPYTDIAHITDDNSIIVAELSSFQLETIHEFKPDISAILNISPDHLNRHHDMDTYISVKEDITKNQDKSDVCILNYEDKVLRKMSERLDKNVLFFSSQRALKNGIYLEEGKILMSENGKRQVICHTDDLQVIGEHNYENVMVAVAIAMKLGVPLNYIKKAITSFNGMEHRIEYVDTINGVSYYNDSKGTNPEASIKAIQAMEGPTILIAGGFDKDSEFDQWIESFNNKVKTLVLMGETKYKIEKLARSQGYDNIFIVDNLKEAVEISTKEAIDGDKVLLSPACASWGMFVDYEERGNLFKEYVVNLPRYG